MNKKETPGSRIRELIDKKGMKDKDFAALVPINPQTLSRILNDKYTVSSKMATKIAKNLDTSPEYILCQTDETNNFVGSEEWYDRNAQNFYTTKVLRYLEDLSYTITEYVIINNLEFKAQSLNTFSTYATQRKLYEYGFLPEDSINIATDANIESYIDYECNTDKLIKKIQALKGAHIEHGWEIEYEGNIERVNETRFINIMYSFALLTQNYFGAAFPKLAKINAILSDIERAINQHAEEIAQETWLPPSKEEDEQRLLHAIYGENIPENPKKEE